MYIQTLLRFFTPLFLLGAFLAGCSESDSGNSGSVSDDFYFALPDEPGEIHSSEELDFYVQDVVSGLSFPWGMAFLPDGSMLITEREGTLRVVRSGELLPDPVGGVPEVYGEWQGGLMDVEIHPAFQENGWIYLSYSKVENGASQTAVMRAKYEADSNTLTDQEDIYVGTPFTSSRFHFGSRIAFDHDGYLFFSIGDRGAQNTAQDLNSSNGSLMRLYDDGRIPEDNPFVGREGLDEIFNYGLRNIQGMAVHPQTGEIWSNLHGPRGGDELNVHNKPGANYGWPVITYGINYDGSVITENTEMEGMEQPVMHWTPSIGPSGMDFVTGERYPGWEGSIFNGALAFQLLSRIVVDGETFVHEERLLQGKGRIRDVRMGPDGFLYFSNESNGVISRLVPVTW
ncbi:MAG: PQQ-dependent sugar dehydrogenase [Balneolaceae bacterium]|nr:MAG: PQQ-dependent sugar dehydrogenase [Balneolaceae bacterium]